MKSQGTVPFKSVPNKVVTLIMVFRDSKILLGMKKRGFGEGKWNGFGGKLEKGETIEQAARRELVEEVCIEAKTLVPAGRMFFTFEGNPQVLEVHAYRCDDAVGEPQETEEMLPRWFDLDEVPFGQMWDDDKHWFPYLIAGEWFEGTFQFSADNRLLHADIKSGQIQACS